MISTRWLEKRKPYWSKLETLLEQSAKSGLKSLSRSDLHVESARLYFAVQLYGLRYFMHHWPYLAFTLFLTLGVAVQCSVLFAYVLQGVLAPSGGVEDESEVTEETVNDDE